MKEVFIVAAVCLAFSTIPGCVYGLAKLDHDWEVECMKQSGLIERSWGGKTCIINTKESKGE